MTPPLRDAACGLLCFDPVRLPLGMRVGAHLVGHPQHSKKGNLRILTRQCRAIGFHVFEVPVASVQRRRLRV